MKFDVIIGNPPYQLSDGGNSASAIPIYHLFVEQAKKLNPRFLTMVIPARWFMGGRGLDAFRDTMLHDNRIRIIHDYPNASDCFPGVEIKGGICYFLWDRDNRGLCSVYSHHDNKVRESIRPLLEEGMDTFIRNDTQISVLNKVKQLKESSFSDILNAGRFFGFHTKISWEKDSIYGTIQSADGKDYYPISKEQSDKYDVKIYIHGGVCWISQNNIPKNASYIHKYKILIPRSGNPSGSILGKPKISEPFSCSSNTYVVAIPNDSELSEKTAQNMITYIQTRFFRYLVAIKTSTQDMAPRAYSFVPVQDFSISWTDEALFSKYNLSEEEIQEIESTIPEMILD